MGQHPEAVYRLLQWVENDSDEHAVSTKSVRVADAIRRAERVPDDLRIFSDHCVERKWLSRPVEIGEGLRWGIQITDTGMAVLAVCKEQRRLAEKSGKENKSRPGRPRKGESGKDMLVVAALAKHHQYESGGSIGSYEPATVRGLVPQTAIEGTPDDRFT